MCGDIVDQADNILTTDLVPVDRAPFMPGIERHPSQPVTDRIQKHSSHKWRTSNPQRRSILLLEQDKLLLSKTCSSRSWQGSAKRNMLQWMVRMMNSY